MTTGVLALEDGTVFWGENFGASGKSRGEVVFNTAMTGYQEILTDPSYAGQILTMTYPLIGNYGINEEDVESDRPQVRGLIVREACPYPSNWRSKETLVAYLERHQVIGLAGVDTRALTRLLRTQGTMRGILSTLPTDLAAPEVLVAAAKEFPFHSPDLVSSVSTSVPYQIPGPGPRVVVVDLGVKRSILRILQSYGCALTVVPFSFSAEEILALAPDGVLFSNGPGNPKDVPQAINTAAQLVGKKPLLGICLGHQVLALALGGDTYKLKFGHRGANHPVKEIKQNRVYITSQNHGYAVVPASLPPEVEITHVNLNDETVEGLQHLSLPVFSIQYHPEASPGPQESRYLFERFLALMKNGGKKSGA